MDACAHVKENTPDLWQLPPLAAEGHKYSRGHALVFGGAELTGAARLAALAAARAGAGLVTLAAPEAAWPVYAVSLLSILVRPIHTLADWQALLGDSRINAVCIGPGGGLHTATKQALHAVLQTNKTLVLDADALTLLAQDAPLRDIIPQRTATAVLTPHEGEYQKLASALGLDGDAEKTTRARQLAKALGSVVLLKGAETILAAPDGRVVRNHARAPWLATAGTGDVLAGIITGLLAQGMDAFDAACAGAWLHSEAARRFGRGMVAEDLLAEIPVAFAQAENKKGCR